MQFMVYPNPVGSNKTIYIKIKNLINHDNLNLIVYDVMGKMVFKEKILPFKKGIDLKQMDSGIYLFLLRDDNNILTRGKIVITNEVQK